MYLMVGECSALKISAMRQAVVCTHELLPCRVLLLHLASKWTHSSAVIWCRRLKYGCTTTTWKKSLFLTAFRPHLRCLSVCPSLSFIIEASYKKIWTFLGTTSSLVNRLCFHCQRSSSKAKKKSYWFPIDPFGLIKRAKHPQTALTTT